MPVELASGEASAALPVPRKKKRKKIVDPGTAPASTTDKGKGRAFVMGATINDESDDEEQDEEDETGWGPQEAGGSGGRGEDAETSEDEDD